MHQFDYYTLPNLPLTLSLTQCDFGCVEDIALIFNRLWPSAEEHEEVARGRRGETEGGCGCCDAAGAGATPPCFGPLSLAETGGGGGGGGGGATPPTTAASASSPADATETSAVRTLPKQLDRSEYAVAKTGIMPMSPCDWWSMYNDLRRHVQRHNSSSLSRDCTSLYDPWCFDLARKRCRACEHVMLCMRRCMHAHACV